MYKPKKKRGVCTSPYFSKPSSVVVTSPYFDGTYKKVTRAAREKDGDCTWCVYVLSLQHGKYYVGRTKNVRQRIMAHKRGRACAWTIIHKMIGIVEIIHGCDAFQEDRYTKIYMAKFGIDNVRGGAYSFARLPQYQLASISKELAGANDTCFRCGHVGHFVRYCPLRIKKLPVPKRGFHTDKGGMQWAEERSPHFL